MENILHVKKLSVVVLLLALCTVSCHFKVFAQAPLQASYLRLNQYAGWGFNGQGALITSLAIDGNGHVWVGTEDTGVWVNFSANPSAPKWVKYTDASGLGDTTCTSLLCDYEGRIWAGTLNHGVSVFNGQQWRNYDSTNGPLGSHVFAIAEQPIDHSIWIATEDGISRYEQGPGTWTYYSKEDGLPSNQISSIAFDSTGTVYVGSQCDGLDIASPTDGYRTWRVISGPFKPTHAGGGVGLPSEAVNTISIGPGIVYVGTDWGLAESTDSGITWHYIRGADWLAMAKGEYPATKDTLVNPTNATMLDDYVTCLCLDDTGNLWVGHHAVGAEVFETKAFRRTGQTSASQNDFVTAIMPTPAGMLFGTYGGGVSVLSSDPSQQLAKASVTVPSIALPTPAAAPSMQDLTAMAAKVASAEDQVKPGSAYYLGDDWDTQGNWLSHYGNQWGLICQSWDGNTNNFFSDSRIASDAFQGPTGENGNGLRSWLADADSKSRCGLYDPRSGKRVVANWNDNGEVYSITDGGGDLWYSITVPAGVYRLSNYFFNNDGDQDGNRTRDYLIEIRPHVDDHGKVSTSGPALATGRAAHFRGSVYKTFIICGPASYDVRLNRNGSMNGIISGYFVDKLSGLADPSDAPDPPWMHGVVYDMPKMSTTLLPGGVSTLWTGLDGSFTHPSIYPSEQIDRLMAYRAALNSGADQNSLAAMRWQTHQWDHQDNIEFDIASIKIQHAANLTTK